MCMIDPCLIGNREGFNEVTHGSGCKFPAM